MVKKKRKKKTKRPRQSSGDLVAIQISAKLKRVPKQLKITARLMESLVKTKAKKSKGEWITTGIGTGYAVGCKAGPDPKGIELKIIRWNNAERYGKGKSDWRYATSQDEAWGTLRRAIQSGKFSLEYVGKTK
jgi:hypothetical protein